MEHTNTPAEGLTEFLTIISGQHRKMGTGLNSPYSCAPDFLLKHGRFWDVAPDQAPGHVVGPEFKACFDNAYRLARRYPKRYCYVEGYAYNTILPLEHAWVVDSKGRVLDPTWDEFSTIGQAYFGVVIPLDVITLARVRSSATALFNWTDGFPLLRKPWEHGERA